MQVAQLEDSAMKTNHSAEPRSGEGHGVRQGLWQRESGQALTEFAIIGTIMMVLALGLIDLGRAIYEKQVITHLTREGSNMAARGTPLTTAAGQVVSGSSPLNLSSSGYVIISAVQNTGGVNTVIDQAAQGGMAASSRIGVQGAKTSNMPATVPAIPQPGQTVYVTEVFYSYQPATPIGKLIGLVMPSTLYDVAYF